MDGKTLARIAAVGFVAVAICATALELNRPVTQAEVSAPMPSVAASRTPLDAELARCGELGEAGGADPSCLRAWGQNRRRFLGQTASADLGETSAQSAIPSTMQKGR